MTIKEITALRKSGYLPEALDAAEIEFSKQADKYTAGALFWCLNELYKKQEKNVATATIERMKSLYSEYCNGDEYMQKSLATAENTLKLHYQEIKEALNDVKNGKNVFENYSKFADLYKKGKIDKDLYPDFGWIIYYTLKNTPVNDATLHKRLLWNYLNLELPRPSILHSLILSEAIKVEQNTPKLFHIREFMKLWGFENLREQDWQQYITLEGNTFPSLVEKLIGVYTKEVKTDKVEACKEISELVDKALERYPQSQNMPYFKVKVLMSQCREDEAINYYRNLILRFPSKYYLWHQIAELIENIDTKLGLLGKALSLGGDEQYLGEVRLSMAKLLIQKGKLQHAKFELDKYLGLYNSKGWKLKDEYRILSNQLGNVKAATENNSIYSEYAKYADEFIYSQLPEQMAVKISEKEIDDKHHAGRKISIWILKTENTTLKLKKPAKFGLDKKLKAGTVFSIRIYENQIVWIKVSETVPVTNWMKDTKGTIKIRIDRNGKQYAIIEGCYVNDKLLKPVNDGQSVIIRSIKKDDGRWSAISLVKSDNSV